MAQKLIYDNRFWRGLLALFGRTFLRLQGWTVVGNLPDVPKFVAIAAPHTSNWDFPLFMAVVGCFRMRVSFFGKHSLFEGFGGRLFYWLGGIPVQRGSANAKDLVDLAIREFATRDQLILGLAPEGTRSKVDKWKSGYYRIAVRAGVPILLAYLDAEKKEIGFGPLFQPTGDADADMAAIQAFYAGKVGVQRRRT